MRTALKSVENQANRTSAAVRKSMLGVSSGASKAQKSVQKSTRAMAFGWKSLLAVMSAIVVKEIVKDIILAGVEMERLSALMKASIGNWLDYGKTMDFLKQRSDDLGLVMKDQIKGFAQLTTSARIAGFTHEELMDIYFGVTDAATAMQLSSDDARLAMRGVVQVLSKGKVQAEELRGQIGERIPGAFQIFANALGMTGEELNKAMEQGQIFADSLPAFGRELTKEFGDKALEAAKTTNSAINRMKTAWFNFQVAITKSGVLSVFRAVVEVITKRLSDPKVIETFQKIAKVASDLATVIINKLIKAFDWLIEKFPTLDSMLTEAAKWWKDWMTTLAKVGVAVLLVVEAIRLIAPAVIWVAKHIKSFIGLFITIKEVVMFFITTIGAYLKNMKKMKDGTQSTRIVIDAMKQAFGKMGPTARTAVRAIAAVGSALAGITVLGLKDWALGAGAAFLALITPAGIAAAAIGATLGMALEDLGRWAFPDTFFVKPKDDAERLARSVKRITELVNERQKLLEKGKPILGEEIRELDRKLDMQKDNIKFLSKQIKLQSMTTEEILEQNRLLEERTKTGSQLFGPRGLGGEPGKKPDLSKLEVPQGMLFGPKGGSGPQIVPDPKEIEKSVQALNKVGQATRDNTNLIKSQRDEEERQALRATERMEKMLAEDQEKFDEMEKNRLAFYDALEKLDMDNLQQSAKTLQDHFDIVDMNAQKELAVARKLLEDVMNGEEMLANFKISLEFKTQLEKQKIREEFAQKERDQVQKDFEAFKEKLRKRKEEIDKFQEKIDAIATFLGDRFGDAFADWVAGTKNLSDAFSDMIREMMNDLARMAASRAFMLIFQQLLGMMGGGGTGFFGSMIKQLGTTIGGGKADGGAVGAGKTYVVGERGPELFSPGKSGMITPNHMMGGGSSQSMTIVNNVSVDGSQGGSLADNRNMGNTISRMIAEQTRSTMLKETRPGGMFNRPNAATART